MSGAVDISTERQNLLIHLLDAVKQCQVRFGGRRELATEGDSRVSCLCAAWESALSHGMRHTNKALSTLKQMTEMTGLSKVASNIGIIENIQNMETEPVFWQYVKEHLSKHEVQRYILLRHVTTDAGRGRAWLRSTFNEHSLEKYMHMILEDEAMITTFYDESAFLRDQERASMLPMMAAGLGSILFAINIDNPDLNAIKPAAGLDAILSSTPPNRATYPPRSDEEPRPVIPTDMSPKTERRKERKKKKKVAHIVSFDDDDGTSSYCSTSPGSSVTSPLSKTSGVDWASTLPTIVSESQRSIHGFTQPSNAESTRRASQGSLTDGHSRLQDIPSVDCGTILMGNSGKSLEQESNVNSSGSNNRLSELLNGFQQQSSQSHIVQNTENISNSIVSTSDISTSAAVGVGSDIGKDMNKSMTDSSTTLVSSMHSSVASPPSRASLDELRCASVMNGSFTGENINQNIERSSGDPTEVETPTPTQDPATISFPLSIEADGKHITSSEGTVGGSNHREVLLEWKYGQNDNTNPGTRAPPDGESSTDPLPSVPIQTQQQQPLVVGSRTDSVSEGYSSLVMGTLQQDHQLTTDSHASLASSTMMNNTTSGSSNISSTSTLSATSVPKVGSGNQPLESRVEDSWPSPAALSKLDAPPSSHHSSPNRSPQRQHPGGSPYQQSLPRPESIKGLDMADRYRIPRCDSSDSMPGSMSDSVRTNDSLRQRFSRWDSTDSADVRSITSNSSFGETGPSPTQTSDTIGGPSLTPLSPEGQPVDVDFIMPISATAASSEDSRSYDSVPSYTEDTENAAYALALTQQGILASSSMDKFGASSPEEVTNDSLLPAELKQALIAMMVQKEETESQKRDLETALEVERDVNTALRAEVDGLKQGTVQMEERDTERIKALSKENELLKHQLRKYVNAVQLLRTQGAKTDNIPGIHLEEVQPTIPPPRGAIDYSHEASEYEKKLIQVAEMHGELMEFNEVLHRQLNVKETTIQRLKQELTDLRGPLPEDFQMSDDSVSVTSDVDLAAFNRPLVNIWIPSAFLRGTGSDAFHVYQVYVRIRDEEWNIYRRYAEFHQLHSKLKKKYPIVNTYEFPQKKTFGNRDPKFVEERRRKLQMYLRQVINLFLQTNPEFVANVSRNRLLQVAPFFGDTPVVDKKSRSKRKISRQTGPTASRSMVPGSSSPAPTQHYMGL